MRDYLYYVGSPAEVEHHAAPLAAEFDVRIVDDLEVVRRAKPGDLCVFYNEFYPRYRVAVHALNYKNCATLYALDGILEWRVLWECPPGISAVWSARPILSHKVACVGRSQARIIESWGYGPRTEIVGVPRFDRLLARQPRERQPVEPFTILVTTAKAPGFNQVQMDRAANSLRDLKEWLAQNPVVNGVPVRAIWRLTLGMDERVGVPNELRDTTGQDMASVLQKVDAMITTPSTSMLEGMLQGVPVALLDYNNAPHLVPAVWRITAQSHLDQVLPELVQPPVEKRHYQQHLLYDALECFSPALPRLEGLVRQMQEFARRQVAAGDRLAFPSRMLAPSLPAPPAIPVAMDYEALFPENPAFLEKDFHRLQTEVADLRDALNFRRAA